MKENMTKLLFNRTSWIQYNKKIAKDYGIYASIILGILVDKDNYWDKNADNYLKLTGEEYNGSFFITREDIYEETALSEHEQRMGENKLKDVGILHIKRKGLPSKNYYTIDYDQLAYCLSISPDVKTVDVLISKPLTDIHQNFERNYINGFVATNNKELITNTNIINKGNKKVDVEKLEKVQNIVQEYCSKVLEQGGSEIEYKSALVQKLYSINIKKIDVLGSNIDKWLEFIKVDDYIKTKTDKRLFIISNPYVWERFIEYTKRPAKRMAWDL